MGNQKKLIKKCVNVFKQLFPRKTTQTGLILYLSLILFLNEWKIAFASAGVDSNQRYSSGEEREK